MDVMSASMLDRFAAGVVERRWLVLILATVVMLGASGGVPGIGVTNDHRVLFDEHDPELLTLEALDATYTESNNALIAIAPASGTVFTPEMLGLVEELTEAAWTVPYATRVDSLTNYSHSEADGDDLIVAPLVQGADLLDEAGVRRIEDIATGSVELAGRLVSRDGRVAAVNVNFALPEETDAAVLEITDHLRALLDERRADLAEREGVDAEFYLTGEVLMNRAFADATRDDLEQLTPVVFLVIVVVTVLLLRSLIAAVAVVVLLMFSINTTMGLAGWAGAVFNPVNAGVPIIVLTIAVADSIHIVTTTLAGLRQGLARNEAIVESLRVNAHPVFLTSVTTAIAFLTLNASESPPFHVLGNLVAFGVMAAFAYSMTVLPAVLSLLPLRAPKTPRGGAFFDNLADFVTRRRYVLLWTVGLGVAVLATGTWRIEFTDNWTRYFDDRYEFRRDTDFVIDHLTGLESWEYSMDSGQEYGITDPKYLRQVDAFAEWLRQQPEVAYVQAFPDVMRRLNRNMHGDDPAYDRLPDDAELASQYLLLYELSLPFGRDLNDRIDVAKSATRVTAAAGGGLTSAQQREFDERAQAWLQENAPELATAATGFTMTFAHLSERNLESMLRATIIAMGGISLVLIFVLRSLRVGLLSLVPNYLPAAMTFGLWGYVVGQVGLAGSVMTAVAFGIIVDDTTHFLTKYQRARRTGADAAEAVRSAFHATGRALWTTTAVLAAGFLVFASSGFEVSFALGTMVAITVVFALLADFLLLPPLLMVLDRRKT
ncbi:MAG: MMPL family transporter [Gammaproteobacteria bacterium]|nr:MMPL family transporter [Gammaproteobacteria bacterium]